MRVLSICTIIIAGALLFFTGCSKASADKLAGGAPCDTAGVGYNKDVLPILQQFCYPCHGAGNTAFGDGIDLQGSDSGYKEVQGWAMGGYVVGNITYAPGFIGMPYGKPKLDDCEIDKIVAWVNQGYAH